MTPETQARFEAKYTVWKERLLDLTAGNRLLNFRETKVSTVRITTPDAVTLFELITLAEKSLKFPHYHGRVVLNDEGEETNEAYRVTAGDLETAKTPPDLERSLYRLTSLARTYREERGINTLYIAVGMLVWRPADSGSPQRAPLVLVPVQLTRKDRLHPYVLEPFDEDPEINPTLAYMLRHDFEYALPSLPDEIVPGTVGDFLNAVERAVKRRSWTVERTAWLGHFQFKKLAMYRDLEEHQPTASSNQRVATIATGEGYSTSGEPIAEEALDDIPPAEVFTALDADASQTQVMIRARRGEDLLVQGPPGTGKSQTIANLIAQFLLDGKKVLFVSEKMAALNVVNERLHECGLDTFCLELHSDKANKRDVLRRIGVAVDADSAATPNADRHFAELIRLRRELNAYVRALHKPMLGSRSAFHVHGDLASLETIPNVTVSFGFDPSKLTEEAESDLIAKVSRLGRFARFFDDPGPYLFGGLRASRWSVQLQTELQSALLAVAFAVAEARDAAVSSSTILGLPVRERVDQLSELQAGIDLLRTSPHPPLLWLRGQSFEGVRALFVEASREAEAYSSLRDNLRREYTDDFFRLNAAELLPDFAVDRIVFSSNESRSEEVRCLLCGQLNRVPMLRAHQRATCGSCKADLPASTSLIDEVMEFLDAHGASFLEDLRHIDALLEDLQGNAKRLGEQLGESVNTVPQAKRAIQISDLFRSVGRAEVEWFDKNTVEQLRVEVRECERQQHRLQEIRERLASDFDSTLFDLPVTDLHGVLATTYRTRMRWFRSGYRRLADDVRQALHTPRRLSYAELLKATDQAAKALMIQHWFTERQTRLAHDFGSAYVGEATDWRAIDARLSSMQELHQIFAEGLLRSCVRDVLSSRTAEAGLIAVALKNQIEEYMLAATKVVQLLGPSNPDVAFGLAGEACRSKAEMLSRFVTALGVVRSKAHASEAVSAKTALSVLTRLAECQSVEARFERESSRCRDAFGELYRGLETTSWPDIASAISWSESFRPYCEQADSLATKSHDSAAISDAAAAAEHLRSAAARLKSALNTLYTFFPDDTSDVLCALRFDQLEEWAQVRTERIGELSDWLQYIEVVDECNESGLRNFIEAARSGSVPAETLERAFLKALRVRQLDFIYQELPPLRRFNVADHAELISRFRQLDRSLMDVHRRRVRAAVLSRRPNLNQAGAGQGRFLRRELAKQRRHAPLRKLFQEAGRIILDLTPCLLMSPLSVATYLQKDAIEFDIAIFDEASQMPIEDAVGTMFRSHQLIVAGDTKQMPPSRFFERSIDDGSEEEEVDQPLESILEDCEASGMGSQPLRWHYRSRHESLIAFSNAEFYDNRLITFPSPTVAPPEGLGVHFEYVADGVYDRGGSRTNRVEARRVAVLVEQHFDSHPDQSLGVIALSTAQAQAIDEEIQRLFTTRPDLESSLRPNGGDSLFVKALENVQGDERDSIIISIGYAKDSGGRLALQFGPVSVDGGERRLNVAFTRARCQLTVVSSIRGGEINLDAVQRRGPKVLRRYLEYAESGELPQDMEGTPGEPESPFEESVLAVLRDRGYEVDCQVGVSRYRIDLAIRHPREPGKYLCGIECDGAAYHSSRVARDRDRLRQAVLEDRRWKIIRIWSTDWIRNRKVTSEKLLADVRSLLQSGETAAVADSEVRDDVPDEIADVTLVPAKPQQIPLRPNNSEPNVVEYVEATLRVRDRDAFYHGDGSALRQMIVSVVEYEGPVHKDVVVGRIARAHGLQRARRIIEEKISNAISAAARMGLVERRGPFLWSRDGRPAVPRRPAFGQSLRAIEHVAPEEISEAAILAIRSSGGIGKDDLPRETARILGYQRTGEKIDHAIRRIITGLMNTGRIEEKGGFLIESNAPS